MKRGDIWWVNLDPTQGSEIKKTRPCVVLTHDTLNRLRSTVVVAPLSTAAKPHPPVTIPVTCQGNSAVAVVDQIRAVAKHRLKSKIEALATEELDEVCQAVSAILELR
ncbi:MAG: type II toxin-antitoxin system PemK/MazF family toxin [Deltaproteobacteria bacterium]|nr:type II toxin-antitoxin system PemK/MazF family toxin [Deltaproteobacteria bacterium]MBW2117404.1 type II toxin-antitoxin system PemK/MazF family toxin [Deltaproteobacteria bacterium]MBW2345746.1 type II toxin-antitoxin system PemK/MazF family toxin [Deltaproteobacteria bacterium]